MDKDIKIGDILVCSWGYSMILTTWVKVIKVSPKSILVREIGTRGATDEERAAAKIGPKENDGFLQLYVMPVPESERMDSKFVNGEWTKVTKDYRLFDRGNEMRWDDLGDKQVPVRKFITVKDRYTKTFYLWDGKPEHEDHCD